LKGKTLPPNGSIFFGICSSIDCVRTYRKGHAIRAGLTQWRSVSMMPGGRGDVAPLDPRVEEACQAILQARSHPRGFCDSCGKTLLFASASPELGECPACHRPYSDGDLGSSSCGECGAPVEIDDSMRKLCAAGTVIAEILHLMPHLKHYGYLKRMAQSPEAESDGFRPAHSPD
jgi:hypothetical protein